MISGNPGLGIVLVSIIAGQGPTVLAVGDGGVCFGYFFSGLSFLFSSSLSFWSLSI